MAAPSLGNKTTNITNPSGTTPITFNHTQDTGDDRILVVAAACNDANAISTVHYNNVLMTQRLYYAGSSVMNYGFWIMVDPPTGSNQVKITMSGSTWNAVGTQVRSFTGASDAILAGNNDVAASPHSRTRTGILQDSVIMQMAVSTQATASATWTVDGASITYTELFVSPNRLVVGTSTLALDAGSIVVVNAADQTWKTLTNSSLEIQGVVASTRRIFLVT